MVLSRRKIFDNTFIRFDTIPECNGLTDGRNCHINIARCAAEAR